MDGRRTSDFLTADMFNVSKLTPLSVSVESGKNKKCRTGAINPKAAR